VVNDVALRHEGVRDAPVGEKQEGIVESRDRVPQVIEPGGENAALLAG